MQTTTVRRVFYRLSGLLAAGYVVYVLVGKFVFASRGAMIGELGEFGLVLASVVAFSVGLLADEAVRNKKL